MQNLFLAVLGMSLEASVAICVVLLLRFCFRKLPKGYAYVLWGLVLFRLLCPVTVNSGFSLMPSFGNIVAAEADRGRITETHTAETAMPEYAVKEPGTAGNAQDIALRGEVGKINGKEADDADPGALLPRFKRSLTVFGAAFAGKQAAVAEKFVGVWEAWGEELSFLWLTGAAWLGLAYLIFCLRWKKKLPDRIKGQSVMESQSVIDPFVCGIFRPVIYLPAGMKDTEKEYILCHEQMHIRHKDPLWRMLWQIALILHWFHPLVWLAAALMRQDMEMFCDEGVIKRYGQAARQEYALVLLRFSMKRSGLPFPVAFGESNTESRIRHILKGKKPAWAVSLAAVLLIGAAALALLTDPGAAVRGTEGAPAQTETSEGAQEEKKASDGASAKEETSEAEERDSASEGEDSEPKAEHEKEATGQESDRDRTGDEAKMKSTAERWASAMVHRDSQAMTLLVKDLSAMDAWKLSDGSYAVGWSSPWPWFENCDIYLDSENGEAAIYYYANVSDSDVLTWREVLELEQTGEGYAVASSELDMDPVDSVASFLDRYCDGVRADAGQRSYRFRGTPADVFYEEEEGIISRAYWYLQQEEEGMDLVDNLRTPETAAARQLYLEGGKAVSVKSPWEDRVCLRFEFADGQTDVICLCRMDAFMEKEVSTSGLWAVEDILTEERYEQALQKSEEDDWW